MKIYTNQTKMLIVHQAQFYFLEAYFQKLLTLKFSLRDVSGNLTIHLPEKDKSNYLINRLLEGNFPISPPCRLSVCHNFLKGRKKL